MDVFKINDDDDDDDDDDIINVEQSDAQYNAITQFALFDGVMLYEE